MNSLRNQSRRALLKFFTATVAAVGMPTSSRGERQKDPHRKSMAGYAAPPMDKIRIVVIGIGRRGKTAIARLVKIAGVEIVAVVDLKKENVNWADKVIRRYMPEEKPPELFYSGNDDFRKAYELDFDLAYICTPWEWHVPMALETMETGAHAAVEVPIALTIEDCWKLVHTSERTRRHCMMLENVCYGEAEMAVRNMCRDNVFGELVHGEAAYLHDLRKDLVDVKRHFPARWRLAHSQKRNGNLYPTHGFGPVAQYMDLNATDHAVSLVSMSSRSLGIQDLALRDFGVNSPEGNLKLRQGDVNTTLIRTRLGRTIMVQFSTGAPRPYSRLNHIQGTKGIFEGYPDRLALDPDPHSWNGEMWERYLEKYKDEDWKKLSEIDRKLGGHGGKDTVMDRRLIRNLQKGLPMDISVYDSVLWSAIAPLSELSVAKGGAPVPIPRFLPQ